MPGLEGRLSDAAILRPRPPRPRRAERCGAVRAAVSRQHSTIHPVSVDPGPRCRRSLRREPSGTRDRVARTSTSVRWRELSSAFRLSQVGRAGNQGRMGESRAGQTGATLSILPPCSAHQHDDRDEQEDGERHPGESLRHRLVDPIRLLHPRVHGTAAVRSPCSELLAVRSDPSTPSGRHRRLPSARSRRGDPPARAERGTRCRGASGSGRDPASRSRSRGRSGSAPRAAAPRPARLR